MTQGILIGWLRPAIAGSFGDVPGEWIARALAAAADSESLVRSDFLRKYSPEEWKHGPGFEWNLRADVPFQATLLYRVSRQLFLSDPADPLLDVLSCAMRMRTGMEIYYSTSIGEGFRVMHGTGLVIGPRHQIGKNFTVYQGVTLGQRRQHCPEEALEIGDDCVLFAGAKILGKLRIGNGVKVAANAVLLCDAEEGATYGGIPAKMIG